MPGQESTPRSPNPGLLEIAGFCEVSSSRAKLRLEVSP
jgi:hypothetical protein